MSGFPSRLACIGCFVIIFISGMLSCASVPSANPQNDEILIPSTRTSSWPVENETVPGIWFRFESGPQSPPVRELLAQLELVIDYGSRRQVISGSAFSPIGDVGGLHQTRYMYLPRAGTLFVTLALRTSERSLFPDTQRIELNGDCWHMLSYRVRGAVDDDHPNPPPYPRTVFLTPALSGDPPLYLEVSFSGNCFRKPLPPH